MTTPSRMPTAQSPRLDRCHRCGGLMVPEPVPEIGSVDWCCVSCGERIDPVILAHRRQVRSRVEAERLVGPCAIPI